MTRQLILYLTFTLVSCGSKSNDESGSSGTFSFVGKWTRNICQDSGDFSNVTVLEFTKTNMIAWDLNHEGDGCNSELFRIALETESLSDLSDSEFTRKSYQSETLNIVMTSNGATTANTINFCGLSDWKKGDTRDIRNKSCVWKFNSSSVAMGTAKDDDFTVETRKNYYQVENDELCFAEKPLIEASTADKICWTRVTE